MGLWCLLPEQPVLNMPPIVASGAGSIYRMEMRKFDCIQGVGLPERTTVFLRGREHIRLSEETRDICDIRYLFLLIFH